MCPRWSLGECSLEGLECLGVVGSPGERGVLACEANQGDDDVGEPTMNQQ